MPDLRQNKETIEKNIREAALKAGREPESVKIIAVTKGVSIDKIRDAYDLGLREFGENYLQEAQEKIPQLPSDIIWHFIGHLQSNKVKKVLELFSLAQSVDSSKLLEIFSRSGKICPCLLEVKLEEEASKFGLPENEVIPLLEASQGLPNLQIRGLMTVPPVGGDRSAFKRLNALKRRIDQLKFPHWQGQELSMGMSDDYAAAVEEGATMVRIGRALFGERSY